MNEEVFAEWMHRQGHRVYRTPSSYWYEAAPRVLQAFPYHWLIKPDEKEIRELLFQHGIAALRYSTPLDFPKGMISYHVVLHEPYELDMLKSQTRNGVKRGLKNFTVEKISFEQLATQGWVLQHDTLVRQDRLRSMTQAQWECLCRSADGLPGFEAWAAISKEKELAAAVIICQIDAEFNVPYAMSHSRFLSDHVNNAIFYSISRELLGRKLGGGIFFTVQSLDAPPNVDEFKFRMGFEARAVRQRVDFHPFLNPLATPMAHTIIRTLLHYDPSNPMLAKTEGMLRFHVEGQRGITEQNWPNCLNIQDEIKAR
jgi:hypothetical protein